MRVNQRGLKRLIVAIQKIVLIKKYKKLTSQKMIEIPSAYIHVPMLHGVAKCEVFVLQQGIPIPREGVLVGVPCQTIHRTVAATSCMSAPSRL